MQSSGPTPNPLFPLTVTAEFNGFMYRINQAPYYRLIFLQTGTLVYTTQQKQQRLCVPALIFIPPNCKCSLQPITGSSAAMLLFTQQLLDQLLLGCWKDRQLHNYIQRLWQTESGHPLQNSWYTLPPELYRDVSEILELIQAEWKQQRPSYQLLILHLILKLFILLFRNAASQPGEVSPVVWQIDDLLDYIHQHYAEEFSLSAMAEKYSFSPSYFSRKFKEKTGVPLFEYINNFRIQKACLLLKRSQKSIIEIAFAVGYNNLSFFNRYFRRIMKMSPREYRNVIQR